jgi:hypothetical protein
MRRRYSIWIFVAGILLAAWILAGPRTRRPPATAPDVKVSFLGLTNQTRNGAAVSMARFRIQNRSPAPVRIKGYLALHTWENDSDGGLRAKPLTLPPGASYEIDEDMEPVGGICWVSVVAGWDTVEGRLNEWLKKHSWQKHVPTWCSPREQAAYTYEDSSMSRAELQEQGATLAGPP